MQNILKTNYLTQNILSHVRQCRLYKRQISQHRIFLGKLDNTEYTSTNKSTQNILSLIRLSRIFERQISQHRIFLAKLDNAEYT